MIKKILVSIFTITFLALILSSSVISSQCDDERREVFEAFISQELPSLYEDVDRFTCSCGAMKCEFFWEEEGVGLWTFSVSYYIFEEDTYIVTSQLGVYEWKVKKIGSDYVVTDVRTPSDYSDWMDAMERHGNVCEFLFYLTIIFLIALPLTWIFRRDLFRVVLVLTIVMGLAFLYVTFMVIV